jgi:hypothetical protein
VAIATLTMPPVGRVSSATVTVDTSFRVAILVDFAEPVRLPGTIAAQIAP